MLTFASIVLSWHCAPRHAAPASAHRVALAWRHGRGHGASQMNGRGHGALQMTAAAAPAESLAAPLRWSEEPDHLWTFTGWSAAPSLRVNYIAAGPEDGQPFLLIHGFGASGFHWRRSVISLEP